MFLDHNPDVDIDPLTEGNHGLRFQAGQVIKVFKGLIGPNIAKARQPTLPTGFMLGGTI